MADNKVSIKIDVDGRDAQTGISSVTRSLTGIKSNAVTMAAGTAFAFNQITAAMGIVRDTAAGVFDFIRDGAGALDVERVFDVQAEKIGMRSAALLDQIRASVQYSMTDLQAQMTANQALISDMSVSQITSMLAYLRQYANATGKSFTQLQSTIFTGLTRGSVLMLDDAGIIIDQVELIAKAERELGAAISESGKKTLIKMEADRQVREKMEQFGDTTQSNTAYLDAWTASISNAWAELKKYSAELTNQYVKVFVDVQIPAKQELEEVEKKIKALEVKSGISPIEKEQQYVDRRNAYAVLNSVEIAQTDTTGRVDAYAAMKNKEIEELKQRAEELKKIINDVAEADKLGEDSWLTKARELPEREAMAADGFFADKTDEAEAKRVLRELHSELGALQNQQVKIRVDLETFGMDDLQKKRKTVEIELEETLKKLEKNRTEENSELTDEAIVEAKTVHKLKLELVDKEFTAKETKLNQMLTLEVSGLNEYERAILELQQKLDAGDISQTEFNIRREIITYTQTKAENQSDMDRFLQTSSMPEYQKQLVELDYQFKTGEITEKIYENKKAIIEFETARSEAESNMKRFIETSTLSSEERKLVELEFQLSTGAITDQIYNNEKAILDWTQSKADADSNMERFLTTTPMSEYDQQIFRLDYQLETGSISEQMYENEKSMLDFRAAIGDVEKGIESLGGTITNQDIKGAFDAMTPVVADFLTVFAQTGEFNISNLANGLLKSLQAYAAQMTAQMLMQGFYHSVMSFVDPANPQHPVQAAKAYAAVPVFAGFVAGSGLAGMAHDGIDMIPETGTWLLKKKERILGARLNEDLTSYLADQRKNITNNNQVSSPSFSFNISGTQQGNDKLLVRKIKDIMLNDPAVRRVYGSK
jgi:hypothetical protein